MPIMRVIRSGSLAALLLALAAVTSSALMIGGRVLDVVTGRAAFPLTVRVLDDSGGGGADARTDSAGVFYANLARGAHVRLRFDLDSARAIDSDTMTVGDTDFVQRQFLVPYVTVFLETDVDMRVQQVHGTGAGLRYPEELRRARKSGVALMQFIVDTTGVARMASFTSMLATDQRFAEAVRAALPRMRFYPAIVKGQKVAQLVQQPFTFTITEDRIPFMSPTNRPPGEPGGLPDEAR